MDLVFTALRIMFDFCILYTVYKIIWYTLVMTKFRFKIKKLNRKDMAVKFKRSFWGTIFGKKGEIDYLLDTPSGTVTVSVITFISVHGRWNIEKARNNYYIEARRKNEWFYKHYVNSGDIPEHAREYKRESRFQRCLLQFPKESADKHILLFVPRPKELTYSELKLSYLNNESTINGFKIMFANYFFEKYMK